MYVEIETTSFLCSLMIPMMMIFEIEVQKKHICQFVIEPNLQDTIVIFYKCL